MFTLHGTTVVDEGCILRRKIPMVDTTSKLTHKRTTSTTLNMDISDENNEALECDIDYQSDSSKFGRGEMHLSAVLEERDIVVYQIGTWEVDGVEVGDGKPASYEFCAVETMQIVWTHNCEHGFIRGLAVNIDSDSSKLKVITPLQFVDFGPEQLVARLPVEWIDDEEALLRTSLPSSLRENKSS